MKNLKTFVPATIFAFTLAAGTLVAQDVPSPTPSAPVTPNANTIPDAVHLIGLPDVRPSATGSLQLTSDGLDFTSNHAESSISYNQISAVFVGQDRKESGGKAGALVRKLPYGVGPVFSLASQKQVDLLTVEFTDVHGGYHGAVFAVPFKTAAALQGTIAEHISTSSTPAVGGSCTTPLANSVLLAPIGVQGVVLPAEYRILFYEQLYHALSTTDTANSYLRAGNSDSAEGCTPLTLHVDVLGFAKGNQAVRAATGPLGFFIDATSVTYHVTLNGPNGKVLLDQEFKKSKRGDTDSLKLAQDIGKDVSKRVDKVMGQPRSSTQQAVEIRPVLSVSTSS